MVRFGHKSEPTFQEALHYVLDSDSQTPFQVQIPRYEISSGIELITLISVQHRWYSEEWPT